MVSLPDARARTPRATRAATRTKKAERPERGVARQRVGKGSRALSANVVVCVAQRTARDALTGLPTGVCVRVRRAQHPSPGGQWCGFVQDLLRCARGLGGNYVE